MKRTMISKAIATLAILSVAAYALSDDRKARELLQSGFTQETIKGDLDSAIRLYDKAIKEAGANRALAAKAQLRLGAAYQKQDSVQARAVLERLVQSYADQRNIVAEAQTRLAALIGPPSRQGTPPGTTNVRVVAGDQRRVTLFDRAGKLLGTVGDYNSVAMGCGAMTISPDSRRVAVCREGVITVYDLTTKSATNVTSGPGDTQPMWSPDGSRIAFQTYGRQTPGVYITNVFAPGNEELIHSPLGNGFTLVDWSPDGTFLTFQQRAAETGYDLWILPLNGERKPIPMLITPVADTGPRLSPDARYLLHRSNESGRSELYVRPFALGTNPVPLPNAEKWRVSADPGVSAAAGARWRADGKEMYYLSADGGFMAVDITTSPKFTAGTPRLLFKVPAAFQAASNTAGFSEVSRDGQIFLLYMPRQ